MLMKGQLMVRDERVQSAIDNWAPRFIANGIDSNDFQGVTNSVERWDDWCQAWSETGAMHEQMCEKAEAEVHYTSAAYHYYHASMAYHFGKFLFLQSPRELRAAHEHTVNVYKKALPYFDFPGEHVAIPEELHSYGDDFLRRGMAVLAIDGPGQGEMEFEHPMRHDYEVPVRYAIDYLEGRPDVDASRVGLMGVSMGGYYAPRAAAFEPRVQAAIAVAGGYNIVGHFDRLPRLTRDAFIARTGSTSEPEALAKLESFNLAGVMEKVRCPLLVI